MNTKQQPTTPVPERWAQLRFAVVGPLLAAPPARGELNRELKILAQKTWQHPVTGADVQFGLSTIERWYYQARSERHDPVTGLKRKLRSDVGAPRNIPAELRQVILEQYRQHPTWSCQLHMDNLRALIKKDALLGPACSYSTLRRFLRNSGLKRLPKRKGRQRKSGQAPLVHQKREVRSFEVEHVGGLWHLDFHHCSRKVLTPDGRWVTPVLLGVLDDHSRLCCHVQWYLHESAQNLVHGLSQALLKRGLPRALLTDNGAAMLAAETVQGLQRLSVLHRTTLPYSPYQNAKQEVFWARVEGRLMSMLEGVGELKLSALNEATQAWVEMEYQRQKHREIEVPPLQRFSHGRSVLRESPRPEELRVAFTQWITRRQRQSDGTITVDNVRFEIPNRYRHLERIGIRYASWDLSQVHLCHPETTDILQRILPLDKSKNASVRRAVVEPQGADLVAEESSQDCGTAPLLQQLIDGYRQIGAAPAYIVKDETAKEGAQ